MAVSTLSIVVTPKPHALQTFNPKPSLTFKPSNSTNSSSSSCSSFRCSSSLNSNPQPNNVRRVLDIVGLGLLASSVVAFSPLDASATRIEYYATVAEPPCELNFARSGLGYCDLAVGSGEVAPLGELVNIHYTARFADGIVFDSSYKRGRPLTMRIGLRKVEDVNFKFHQSWHMGQNLLAAFQGTATYLRMQLLCTTSTLLTSTREIGSEGCPIHMIANI
ncbi:hypothetical protein ACSBR1_009319 [Camellia fascicularis]